MSVCGCSAGALERLAVLTVAEPKSYAQLQASRQLCAALSHALEVVVATAINSKGAAQDVAAIAFLASFCTHSSADLMTMVCYCLEPAPGAVALTMNHNNAHKPSRQHSPHTLRQRVKASESMTSAAQHARAPMHECV
jgi:hypothetical protein